MHDGTFKMVCQIEILRLKYLQQCCTSAPSLHFLKSSCQSHLCILPNTLLYTLYPFQTTVSKFLFFLYILQNTNLILFAFYFTTAKKHFYILTNTNWILFALYFISSLDLANIFLFFFWRKKTLVYIPKHQFVSFCFILYILSKLLPLYSYFSFKKKTLVYPPKHQLDAFRFILLYHS